MSNRFKMPKPVFSTDDLAQFEQLTKMGIEDDSVSMIMQNASPIYPGDMVSEAELAESVESILDDPEEDPNPIYLYVRGDFRNPIVQKFFLDQMTYEDSYFWRIARGRMDLNDLEAGTLEMPEGTA